MYMYIYKDIYISRSKYMFFVHFDTFLTSTQCWLHIIHTLYKHINSSMFKCCKSYLTTGVYSVFIVCKHIPSTF